MDLREIKKEVQDLPSINKEVANFQENLGPPWAKWGSKLVHFCNSDPSPKNLAPPLARAQVNSNLMY